MIIMEMFHNQSSYLFLPLYWFLDYNLKKSLIFKEGLRRLTKGLFYTTTFQFFSYSLLHKFIAPLSFKI